MNEKQRISIGQYLVHLAEKPELVEAFRENPERAMRDAGLSREDRDLILSGDVERVRQAVVEEFEGATVAFMIWPPIVRPLPKIVWP